MPNLEITRRPIVLETSASGATLNDILIRLDRLAGRGSLYGISDTLAAKLFASETIEAAFGEGYYREEYAVVGDPSDLTGWEAFGGAPVITSAGLAANSEDGASAILFAPPGDFTVFVDADVPASTGANQILASVVGGALEQRIVLYRNEANIYCLQVYNGVTLTVAAGPTDGSAKRVRAAVSSEAGQTRACFNGGSILSVVDDRPIGLLRLWLGILALGQGATLEGGIRTAVIRGRASSDAELIAITAPVA